MTHRAFRVGGAGRHASHVAAPFIVPAISGRALQTGKAPFTTGDLGVRDSVSGVPCLSWGHDERGNGARGGNLRRRSSKQRRHICSLLWRAPKTCHRSEVGALAALARPQNLRILIGPFGVWCPWRGRGVGNCPGRECGPHPLAPCGSPRYNQQGRRE